MIKPIRWYLSYVGHALGLAFIINKVWVGGGAQAWAAETNDPSAIPHEHMNNQTTEMVVEEWCDPGLRTQLLWTALNTSSV